MNKLKRDTNHFLVGLGVVGASFLGLGLLNRVQLNLGLTEAQLYEQYPISWYVGVALGPGFIASLIYSVKKAFDTHPNIQLRSAPVERLENVLADPEYKPWHKEAARLLKERQA